MNYNRQLLIAVLFFSTICKSAIDNRYLPMFNNAYQHQTNKKSILFSNIFIATANESYVEMKGGSLPLPEIFGKYDMVAAARALAASGKTNPLPSSWQTVDSLECDMNGKLHAQGFWVGFEQNIYKDIAVGFQVPFMHVSTQLEFEVSSNTKSSLGLGAGGDSTFYKVLNDVNKQLGFDSYQWKRTALGDLDLYLRWSAVYDYAFKCKHIDASFKVGTLLPIADQIDLKSPMPIPFGAHNHVGFYFETDFNCELKDDWKAGFWFNATKRAAKTQVRRMPVRKELPQFGALTGEVFVDPGFTVGFSPYIWLDDIREGLGARASFTMAWHWKDYWRDKRVENNGIAPNFTNIVANSDWDSEYFTIGLVYDLLQTSDKRENAPCFYLNLDIPSRVFSSDKVSKTHRLAFGFEFNF